jgi:hypothetical protein
MLNRSHQAPRTFTGSFTRADDGVSFVYSITISPIDGGSVHFSLVTVGDSLRGRPSGMFKHGIMDDVAVNIKVRLLVEAAIRDRAGVN